MQSKLSTIAASAVLFVSSCDNQGSKETRKESPAPRNHQPVETARPAVPLLGSRDPRALAARASVTTTIAAINDLATEQQRSFETTGTWLREGVSEKHLQHIFASARRDLLREPDTGEVATQEKILQEINRSGYHLYVSHTAIGGQPYLTVSLFALGDPKNATELDNVKRLLHCEHLPARMRELILIAGTPHGDELYGSVSKTGDILISPWSIQREVVTSKRNPNVMFAAVLANELGHLKLEEAQRSGSLKLEGPALSEAYSDYCTFVVTPASEVVPALLDVMGTETYRYDLSKGCIQEALNTYGKQHVPGFRGVEDRASMTILFNQITNGATPTRLETLRAQVLRSYEDIFIAKGLPASLFSPKAGGSR